MTFIRKHLPFVIVLVALMPGLVHAQAIAPADTFMAVATTIQNAIDNVVRGNPLEQLGWTLFSFFVAANVIWYIVKGFMTGGGISGVLADLVPLCLLSAVGYAFLGGTASAGGSGAPLVVALEDSLNIIGNAITGTSARGIGELIVQSGEITIRTIMNIWSQPVNSTPTSFSFAGVIEAIASIPMAFYTVVAAALSSLLVLVSMAIYMGTLVMTQMSIEIAKLFAPLFVPFLLFRPASWMFDGWLRFFLGASILKIVGLLLLQFTEAILDGMLQLSQMQSTSGLTGFDAFYYDFTKMSFIFLMAGLSAMMMAKAPSISSGLLSGNNSIGFGGWSDVANRSIPTKMLAGQSIGGGGSKAKPSSSGGGGGGGGGGNRNAGGSSPPRIPSSNKGTP